MGAKAMKLALAVLTIVVLAATPAQAAQVFRVVDGDTLVVYYCGRPVRVRLIGVDTPESLFRTQRDVA